MNNKTQMIVEAGLMIALATILSQFKIFRMPAGGSVTPGSMIPILIFAMRWGWKQGCFVGVVYGLFQMVLGGYVIHPMQAILDYPVAFGCLGFAGFAKNSVQEVVNSNAVKGLVVTTGATVIAIVFRMMAHVLSGVIFFAPEGATFTTPAAWTASIAYNGGFLVAELAITIVVLSLLMKPIMTVYMAKEA